MVKVFELSGYRFFFYSNEGREPPCPCGKQDGEAKFWLEGCELAGSHGFAAHEIGRIRDMIVDHHQLIGQAWRDRFG